MNVIEKARNLFSAKAKRQRLVLWPTWAENTARWQLTSLDRFVTDGFELNAVLYAAVMYKARAASGVPLRAYLPDGRRAPADAPLSLLLARPNRMFSWQELAENVAVHYNLFGEAYVYAVRRNMTAPPESLFCLRPDRVVHLYRDGELQGYEYLPAGATVGFPLLPEDVLHLTAPNPGDRFEGFGKGFSPVFPVARAVDVDNAATDFLKQFFNHGALPAGILKFDVPLDDDLVAQAQDRWSEVHGGYQRWAIPAVMDSGGSYQRIGLSLQELDMAALDARSESRITMVLGVPLNLIESRPSLTQGTYSNKEQDRRMFWEDTMLSELHKLEAEWQYLLGGPWGGVAYDFSAVPALEAANREKAALYLTALGQSAVTTDEFRAALGLPPDPRGAQFVYPLGIQLIPATAASTTAPAATAVEEDRDGAEKTLFGYPVHFTDNSWGQCSLSLTDGPKYAGSLTPETKALLWKAVDATARKFEPPAAAAVERAFEHDRRAILGILSAAQKAAYRAKASVAWQLLLLEVLDYIKMSGKANWRNELLPILEAVITAQGTYLSATFGMVFNARNLLAEEWFTQYTLVFVDPITKTTEETLTAMFQEAMAQGYSIPDMEKSLNTLFEQWAHGGVIDPQDRYFADKRLPPYRREMIARTETMRASNAGGFALYKDWNVQQKEWYATNDQRTRDTHRVGAAVGQAPLVVSIDAPFIIGGAPMMFPGDPSAPVAETVNCRCTLLPVIKDR